MTPDANGLCVFAVKRGNIEKRLDINFNLPQYATLINQLRSTFGDNLKPIGEIADVICGPFGSAIKNGDYLDAGIPLVRITNISKDGYMDYSDLVYISEGLGNSLERTQVSAGDIVISQRGSLGQCAVVDDRFPKLNISANIIAIKNIKETSATFIHDYLLSSFGQKMLERSTSGQVQQKITTQDIADVLIPIGCNEKKLCEIVSKAYSRTSKMKELEVLISEPSPFIHKILGLREITNNKPYVFASKMNNITHARFDPEFHNPFYTNRVKEIKKLNHDMLGNVVDFSSEIWDQKSFFYDEFPYIEIAGVQLKKNKYSTSVIPVSEAPSRAKMIVRQGDIIVSTTRPHRGAIATVNCRENEMQIASTGFCVLRDIKRSDVSKEYLQWILLDDYILLQMLQRSSGGNYPAITADELKQVIVPIPDIETQSAICREASERMKQADALRMSAEKEWTEAKAQFERELLGES